MPNHQDIVPNTNGTKGARAAKSSAVADPEDAVLDVTDEVEAKDDEDDDTDEDETADDSEDDDSIIL